MAKYQFTMFSEKYKPVACIIEAENRMEIMQGKKPYIEALKKICIKRGWQIADLKKFGYNTFKVRKAEEQGA